MALFYRTPKAEVRENAVSDSGIFAKTKISKGEVIAIKVGHIVDSRLLEEKKDVIGDYMLQFRDNYYLAMLTKEEIFETAIFINHSCDPNVGIDGDITFVAMRDIEPGEELCYDYAMDTTREYRLECKCGAKDCRKIITGNDWQIPELQKRYGHYFSHYILKKIYGWE